MNLCRGQSAGSPGVALLEATDSWGIMAHKGLWEFPAARRDTQTLVSHGALDGWPCVASGRGSRSQLSTALRHRSSF